MKNLIVIFVFCIIYVISTSCEKMFGDFLNKAPGVDVTVDTLFASTSQMEIFLAGCYKQGMYDGFPEQNYNIGTTAYGNNGTFNFAFHWCCCSDEAKNPTTWYFSNTVNSSGLNISNAATEDPLYPVHFNLFRMAYTMLDKVDNVPGIDVTYAGQIKGEMKFLIALNYFEMFKRYGGVPVITKFFQLTDNVRNPRSSVDSTVQFIVKNCDEAAAVLPDFWPPNWKGRVTKGSALALKAKTLLYAASPLFNTSTPFMEMTDPANNKLICYTNYDVNRWKLAADAAKAVLDWAPSGSIQLVTDKGFDKNYKYVWEVCDNSEILLACKALNGALKASSFWQYIFPLAMNGWGGQSVNHNFVENFYDKRDGTPETWAPTGTDLNQKYAGLDYRFSQTIGYNGFRWNNSVPILETWKPTGLHINGCITGYWMKKFIPDAQTTTSLTTPINWPLFRLAEFYLIYAEALNEFNATPPLAAYTAVNTIRARSGMPDLPTGLNQAQFRDRVRKEWGVEFAFEDHRFWDVKRWLIAENSGVMAGPMVALSITKGAIVGGVQQFTYVRSEYENRVFPKSNYLLPFRTSEVNKGYIIQNPGY